MKTTPILLLTALVLAGVGSVRAFDPVKGLSKTEVSFFEPENFTDASDRSLGSEQDRKATLAELKEYLVKGTRRYLSPGQTLTITVTNVDLAGEFEPWRGGQFSDVRIVKDMYPPRVDLVFRLTDSDGAILREGKRELRDPMFMMKLTMAFRDDPLRHEKALLDDWLRAEFRSLKKD